MGSTIVSESRASLEMNQFEFRGLVLKKVMSLTPQNSRLCREVQFCAVSIIDKYLLAWERRGKPIRLIRKAVIPFAIVAIISADKFVRGNWIRIQKLGKLLCWQLVLEIEPEVLKGIDFCIPIDTPYTALEQCLIQHDLHRIQLCIMLKILICAAYYSTELSQCPQKMVRIFENVHLNKDDAAVNNYLQQVFRSYKKMKDSESKMPLKQ